MGKRADGRRSGGVETLSATRRIVLIAFDGVQILDVAGPL